MSEQPGLTGEQIADLISGTAEPDWRPDETAASADPGDENDAEETDPEAEASAEDTVTEDDAAEAVAGELPKVEDGKFVAKDEKADEAKPDPLEEVRQELASLKAKYDLQLEHNARLSGKIGELTDKQRKASTQRDDDEPVDDDRAARLERRFDETEAARTKDAVRSAVVSVITAHDAQPEVKALLAELEQVAPSYKHDLQAAAEETDPARAARLMELTMKAMVADAKALKNQAARKSAEQVQAASQARTKAAKKAASPPGRSGAVAGKAAIKPPDSGDPAAIAAYYRAQGRPGW